MIENSLERLGRIGDGFGSGFEGFVRIRQDWEESDSRGCSLFASSLLPVSFQKEWCAKNVIVFP